MRPMRGRLVAQTNERGHTATDRLAQPAHGGVVAAGLVIEDPIAIGAGAVELWRVRRRSRLRARQASSQRTSR